jgi:hypothetical protein
MKNERRIDDVIEEKARTDSGYAIAYALLKVAEAQKTVATHIKYLGVGDAATTMGAIEFLSVHIGEKIDNLASAIIEAGED